MQSLMFLGCFDQKVSKKNLWEVGSTLGKERVKIIFITVLSTAVFLQFLLIPRPYTHNFSCGGTLAHN